MEFPDWVQVKEKHYNRVSLDFPKLRGWIITRKRSDVCVVIEENIVLSQGVIFRLLQYVRNMIMVRMVLSEVQQYGQFEGQKGEVYKPKTASKWRVNFM